MRTFYALETFYTKKCGCFWQVRLTADSFSINHSSQRIQRDKDHSRRQRRPGSPGLNLSTMRPTASRARRCPVSRWQAGRATGKWVRQGLHIQYPLKVFIQTGRPNRRLMNMRKSAWGDVTSLAYPQALLLYTFFIFFVTNFLVLNFCLLR